MKTIAYTAAAVELVEAPDEIKILPFGYVKSRKGDFVVDQESLQTMQKIFKERGIDIVIDYEHQTLENVEAPAGGWIKELYQVDSAVVAKVEWTPRAREYISNKEYRYLSPVVLVRESDKKAVCLNSVGLTNTPAIDGMYPIVNSVDIEDQMIGQGGNGMELEKLIQLLGLPAEATKEDVEKALSELTDTGKNKTEEGKKEDTGEVVANKTILTLLGLEESAKTEDVSARIVALKASEGTDIRGEFLTLKEKLERRDALDKVSGAMKEGKIMAAQKEWATEYALKDPEGFDRFLEKAAPVVPMGSMVLVDAPESALVTGMERVVMKNMGLTEEDLKKYGEQGGKG